MEKRKMSTGNRFVDDHVSKETKRKRMKPITEKIRRERINNSLDELKLLVLSALNEDVSHYAKMEKADILEMAVKYIKRLQNVKQGLQGECSQVTKRKTAIKISSVTTVTSTTPCKESHSSNIPTEPPRSQTKPTIPGSLNLVLPEIPITIPDVTKETPACGDGFQSTNTSSLLHDKEVNSFLPFPNYNDSKRSPFAVKDQNAPNTSSYNPCTGEIIDNRPEKVRLPGMECFISSNSSRTFFPNRETDKENASNTSFEELVYQYQRGLPLDNLHFPLTLWRPW